MKKLVLSAAVAVLGIVGMNAQVDMEAVQVGARAGYNLSSLRGDAAEDVDTKSLSGYHAGLFVEVPISERFSIQPEVIYSTQGAKWEVNDDNFTKLKTQYLSVPILAKFYVAEGFNLQAGPQISFMTGAKSEGEILGVAFDNDDVKDGLKGTDFGLLLGAGYKISEGVTVDARYGLGFSDVFDKDTEWNDNLSSDNEFKNGVFQIGIGYQF